jgi:peroxiredoxin
MGTEDNEDMTEFRLKANELTPPQIPQEARRFIIEHLSSPVSLYLLQRYFVYTTAPEYDEAYRLCQHIIDEGGGSGAAIRLSKQIAVMKNNAIGKQLPAFSAKDTNGKTVSNRQLKADVNVVCLWALWNRTSLSQLRTLRTLRKEHQERVSVVSICIDADQADAKHFLERDSIDWPNVCDGEMWQTTVAQKLNLTTMPANVITDKKGKIVARNITSAQQLKEKIEELLKDQKDK